MWVTKRIAGFLVRVRKNRESSKEFHFFSYLCTRKALLTMKMKRLFASLTAIVLALLVVQLTVGVTFAHCMHTGRNFIVSTTEMASKSMSMTQMSCNCTGTHHPMVQHRCMEYTVKHLSPSVEAPVFHPDFTAVQPLLFAISSFVSSSANGDVLPQEVFCPSKVPIPPRAYLARLRVLII